MAPPQISVLSLFPNLPLPPGVYRTADGKRAIITGYRHHPATIARRTKAHRIIAYKRHQLVQSGAYEDHQLLGTANTLRSEAEHRRLKAKKKAFEQTLEGAEMKRQAARLHCSRQRRRKNALLNDDDHLRKYEAHVAKRLQK